MDYGTYRSSRTKSYPTPAEVVRRSATGKMSYGGFGTAAPSTSSWVVQNQQNHPAPPPPAPLSLPSPVETRRPDYEPHTHRPPLRAINLTAEEEEEEYMNLDVNTPAVNQDQNNPYVGDSPEVPTLPMKKKSFVGGFVRGIRRLPKAMFGYGGAKKPPRRRGTFESDITVTDDTGTSDNNLPKFTYSPNVHEITDKPYQYSRPPRPLPIREESDLDDAPLPEVVRVGDHRENRPTFRILPPSPHIANEERAEFYDHMPTEHSEFNEPVDGTPSTLNRTTVMLYNEANSIRQTPRTITRELSHDPRVSYVSEDHPIRPESPGVLAVEPPERLPTPGPRVTYVPQAPPRRPLPQPILPPPPSDTPEPPLQPLLDAVPEMEPPPPAEDPEAARSPVSVHPLPANDYLKMGDAISTRATTRHTFTTFTSYFEPSFISDFHPVENFFKLLYRLPWVAQERVTVDYMPGDTGKGKSKRKYKKPMTSWYHAVLAQSRRNSLVIDQISNGTRSHRTKSSEATSHSPLMSQLTDDSARHHRHRSHRERERHYHQSRHRHQQSRSNRHRHRHHSKDSDDHKHSHSGGHMVPTVFPYPYPTYPYSAYPFPLPALPASPIPDQNHDRGRSPTVRGQAQDIDTIPKSLHPAYPHGYTPYQPLMSAPLYVLPTPPANIPAKPPALAPVPLGKSADEVEGKGKTAPQSSTETDPKAQTTLPGSFSSEAGEGAALATS